MSPHTLSLISPLFQRDEGDIQSYLLVIQCDSGHLNADLIACARNRVYDERVNALNKNKLRNREDITHILFIINLPHQVSTSTFVGFQGDPWISAHIDDLRPLSSDTIEPLHASAMNISELFIGKYIHNIAPLLDTTQKQIQRQKSESDSEESLLEEERTVQEMPLCDTVYPTPLVNQKLSKRQAPSGQCRRLYSYIQAAISRLEDSTKDRTMQRVIRLTKLIQRSPDHLSIFLQILLLFSLIICFSICRS